MLKDKIDLLVERFMAVRHSIYGRYNPIDGSIYYLSDISGEQVLWRSIETPRGYIQDLVFPWDRRINDYKISSRGHIAFSTDRDGDERWSIYVFDRDSIRLVVGEDETINNLGEWSPDGRFLALASNYRNRVDFDLYVYDLERSVLNRVLENDGMIVPSEWVDNRVFLAVKMHTYQDTDILLVDSSSGSAVNLTRHESEAINTRPTVINDRYFIFITNRDREFSGVALYDLVRREWRYILLEEWDIELIDYDNGFLAYVVNENGSSVLKISDLDGKIRREILRVDGTIDHIDFRSGRLILSINSPRHGLEIFRLDLGGELVRVTHSPKAGLSEEEFVSPERFAYRSFDNLLIHGLLYRPLKPLREPPPAVVYLHGGPESQERVWFNRVQQALLRLGVAVVAPNYRGSSGYGKTFIHLDDVEKRINAVHDVYHALDYLGREKKIDLERLCVMGASYGGYLTLMMLSIYPEIWRCGVEIVGIVNLLTFIKNTGAWRRRYRVVEYGDPEKHADIMLRLSPISYVDKIRAPLMIVHGARDPRVPVSEAEQLVEALRNRDVEIRYIRLDDEGHGISKVRNRIKVYSEVLRFIYNKLTH